MIAWIIAPLVTLAALVGLIAAVLGLPGTWLMVVIAILLASITAGESFVHVSWLGVIALVVLAGIGELIEFIAGSAGVGQQGGTKRSAWYALVGSMVGAVAGLFISLPIPVPVISQLISSVLFGAMGAAAGAVIGERREGKDWDKTTRVGIGALIGRLLGTVGKAACAAIMTIILIYQVWLKTAW